MKRLLILALAAAVLATGCAAAHKLAAKTGCLTTTHAWYKHGGKAEARSVGENLKAVGQADTAASNAHLSPASLHAVAAANSALTTSIRTMQQDPPPSCVPGLRADLSAGLGDFAKGITKQNAAVKLGLAHHAKAAVAAFQASGVPIKAGGLKFIAALHAISAYVKG